MARPGYRRNANELHSYVTKVSVAALISLATVSAVIALLVGREDVAFSVALGSSVVIVTSLLGWAMMRLFDRLKIGGGWVMAGSYVLKLLALALVIATFDDHALYVASIVGLAFVVSILIHLVITTVIITRHQSPIIDA